MADPSSGRSLWDSLHASWPTLVGLGTAVLLGVLTLPPIESSRPSTVKVRPLETIGEQDVDVRLWQDPLNATEPNPDASPGAGDLLHGVDYFRRQLRISANTTLVLPVVVGGGPYAEDTEGRIRSRVAVVSALGRAHYVPQDGEHVGFFRITDWPRADTAGSAGLDWWQQQAVSGSIDRAPPSTARLEASATQPATKPTRKLPPITLVVPYEWWYQQGLVGEQPASPDDVRPQRVLVLWMRDEAISDWPLRRFARLVDDLFADPGGTPPSMENRMKVLGPRRSGTVRNMVLEAASRTLSDAVKQRLKGIKVYSATATAADDSLTFNSGIANRSVEEILWGQSGVEFVRPVATDDMLCDALLEELKLRGVDIRGGRAAVALVSEWDTLYGRALPLTFSARAQIAAPPTARPGVDRWVNDEHMKSKFLQQLANPGNSNWPKIYHYGYLRGIDGLLPGTVATRSVDQRKDPLEEMERGRRAAEIPEGLNQADYLRRLAQVLVRQDRQLRRDNRGIGADNQGLAAVGILGSDLYDKLMILRALRRELPSTLFFTTDLDVRMTHPSEWAETHNLIVAAPFGLQLRRDIQMDIPPFRDSYQTSLFHATLLAINALPESGRPPASRVFEIGRGGPHDLSQSDPRPATFVSFNKPQLNNQSPPLAQDGVHPPITSLRPWWLSGPTRGTVAALLGVVALVGLVLRRVAVPPWRELVVRLLVGLGLVFVVAVLIWVGHWMFDQYDLRRNEPVTLTDGISIWPTEAIRVLAIVVGVLLLVKGRLDLHANEKALHERFGVPSPDDLKPRNAAHPYGHAWKSISRWRSSSGPVNAERVWSQYLRLARRDTSAARILVMSTIYVVAAMAMFLIFGFPHVPYRGDFSWWVDLMILILAVLVQVALIFFAVDAIRLCKRMIEHLGNDTTQWPPIVSAEEARVRGVQPGDVGEYLDIQFVAMHTAAVGKLILYPFLILVLMMIARLAYFDNWDWPAALLLVFLVNFLYAIFCQWMLSSAVAQIRIKNVLQMNEAIRKLPAPPDPQRVGGLERLIQEMETERRGAFAPINEQPLAAVLLSTLALGLWQLASRWILQS